MKFTEIKQRLDPKCWTGKKIGNPKTKVKGGVRVNNCVPAESVEEAQDTAPKMGAKEKKLAQGALKGAKDMSKAFAGLYRDKDGVLRSKDTKQQGVAEDISRRGFLKGAGAAATLAASGPEIATLVKGFAEKAGGLNGIQALKAMLKVATARELYNMYDYQADSGILADAITDSDMRTLQRVKGFREYEDWSEFEEYCEDNGDVFPAEEFERLTGQPLKVALVNNILKQVDSTWSLEDFFDEYPDALELIDPFQNGSISMPTLQQLGHIDTAAKGANLPTPIVAAANAIAGLVRQIFKSNGQPLTAPQQVAQTGRVAAALPAPTRPEFDMATNLTTKQQVPVRGTGGQEQGVAEEYNVEYDDEAGMADNNLSTLRRAVEGLDDLIDTGDNLPEWCQEKIAVAKSMLVAVWDYMESADDSEEEEDPEVVEMYEALEQLAEELAQRTNKDVEQVWETFEALDDQKLYETAAWRRKAGKNKNGGLNAKGVASYRRENPGSKLQTAVTTKPSKLKPGSKAAKRRKSFCARMSGVKGPMKKPNGKPTRKALALRKWNC